MKSLTKTRFAWSLRTTGGGAVLSGMRLVCPWVPHGPHPGSAPPRADAPPPRPRIDILIRLNQVSTAGSPKIRSAHTKMMINNPYRMRLNFRLSATRLFSALSIFLIYKIGLEYFIGFPSDWFSCATVDLRESMIFCCGLQEGFTVGTSFVTSLKAVGDAGQCSTHESCVVTDPEPFDLQSDA